MRNPLSRPAPSANTIATRIAGTSLPLSPSGMCVTVMTVMEITPATDRSIPPCWITSIWPRPATASTEAIGSMPRSAVPETLDGAARALTTNSSTVAQPMVSSPFETLSRGPGDRTGRAVSVSDIVTSRLPAPPGVAGVTVERDCTKAGERGARG